MLTLLSSVFVTERHRPRAGNVGYSMPLASEIETEGRSIAPLVITTTQGTFIESRVARHGYVRFGFSECEVEQEGQLLQEFHRVLVARSTVNGWPRASTIEEAVSLMQSNGIKPRCVVAGPWLKGVKTDGLKVVDAGFPYQAALLVTDSESAGLHTRVGAYVGIVAYRVNRGFVAVTSSP